MEIKTKEYKLGEETLYFRNNMRAMIEFERLAKKKMSLGNSMEDGMMLLYCGTISGMKKEGKAFKHSYDEFIDMFDDNFDVMDQVMDTPEPGKKK